MHSAIPRPFLLLLILAAVMLLIAETGIGRGNESLQRLALTGPSGLLLCASTHNGATWLPIQEDLRTMFGSSLTVTLAAVFGVYLWMTIRGLRQAIYGLPATLVVTGLIAPLPEVAQAYGMASWMFPAAACVILLVLTLRMASSDWIWTSFAGVAATTIAMVGDEYGQPNIGLVFSSLFATTAMLVIGARFDSHLAVVLRHLAATVMIVAVAFIFFRTTQQPQGIIAYTGVAMVSTSLIYGLLIRKRGWLRVAMIQAVICTATLGLQQYRSGSLRRINWPIASGMFCLGIGIAITTGKSERYQKLAGRRHDGSFVVLDPGL